MAMNPLIPLAGLGALAFMFFGSKSNAAAPPGTPEGQGGPPLGTPKPPATLPTGPRPTSELSEAQRERMAEALGRLGVSPATGKLSGAADAEAIRFASQVVGELDAAGFKDAASALRAYVDEASKAVKTPVEAAPIAQAAAQTGMTKEQAEYAARILALERDPNKIGLFIDWLKKLSPSPQRDTMIQMAQALALQLEAANATTQTIDKITEVINSTPEEPDDEDPPVAPARPVYTSTSPGQPTGRPPTTTATPPKPLPETPKNVPASPVPQTAPAPLTDGEIVARSVVANLGANQQKFGIKGAKGKEDKLLVKKFQAIVGLTQDGSAGPATYILLAGKGAVNLPLVYYWPKTATAATVAEYRSNLEKIAKKLEENGRRDEANTLRVSIAREHGEGGINGPLFGAPAAAARPAAPKPPAPAATTSSSTGPGTARIPEVNITASADPFPGRLLMLTSPMMKGDDVKRWQMALKKGFGGTSYNVGDIDGVFGKKSDEMTRAFQRDFNLALPAGNDKLFLAIDGKVGPAVRTRARALGMW